MKCQVERHNCHKSGQPYNTNPSSTAVRWLHNWLRGGQPGSARVTRWGL